MDNVSCYIASGRISHACILCGKDEAVLGKAASDVAGALLCRRNAAQSACGECLTCRMIKAGTNPDLKMVKAEGQSIGVDLIRNITDEIIVKPVYSDKKVFLISNGEKMTQQAQNALLKTLEEPPSYAVIIITTRIYDSLLETVRSRAVKIDIDRAIQPEFASESSEPLSDEEKEDADRIESSVIELLFGSGDILGQNDSNIMQDNTVGIEIIFDKMLQYYRDLMMIILGMPEDLLINLHRKDIIKKSADKFSIEAVVQKMKAVEDARHAIRYNANRSLVADVLLMTIQEDYE